MGVIRVSEPTIHRQPRPGATLERTRQEVLDGARPLPPDEQSVIDQLTDDEARRFLDAILDT
jgi:hypothetical protein